MSVVSLLQQTCVPVISWNHGSDGFENLVPSTSSGEQCLQFCLRVAYQNTGHRLNLLNSVRSVSCDLGGLAQANRAVFLHPLLLGVFLLKTSLPLVFVADTPCVWLIKIQGNSIGFLLFEIPWHVPVLRNTE